MVNNSDKLYKAYLGELKEQVCFQICGSSIKRICKITFVATVFLQMTSSTREPKLFVVAGCLKGVAALMINFTKTVEEGAVLCSI